MDAEETCGQELSRDAEVPRKLGQLMAHVARNLRAHAVWVGTRSAEAKLEHDALQQVAAGYEAISEAASRTAAAMTSMRDLPPAPHDPKCFRSGVLRELGCARRWSYSATWRSCYSNTLRAPKRRSKDESSQWTRPKKARGQWDSSGAASPAGLASKHSRIQSDRPSPPAWSGRVDSNHRPLDPQSSALTRLRYAPNRSL